MKIVIISLSTSTGLLAVLWFAFGGPVLLIGLATISAVCLVISCFTLGIWYAHKSIQLGAQIANEAVNNNDKWDSVKMQSLAKFGGEMLRLKGGNEHSNGFPLLEESSTDFDLLISGIDE